MFTLSRLGSIKMNCCSCSVSVVHLNKSEHCHPDLGVHQTSRLRPPEKVVLDLLPNELWCGSTDICLKQRLKTSNQPKNTSCDPKEDRVLKDGSFYHRSFVAITCWCRCQNCHLLSADLCAMEEFLDLFWLLYTFYKFFVSYKLVKITLLNTYNECI